MALILNSKSAFSMKLVYKTEERTADKAGVGEADKNNFF